jgi:hypothetical protein
VYVYVWNLKYGGLCVRVFMIDAVDYIRGCKPYLVLLFLITVQLYLICMYLPSIIWLSLLYI